MGLFDTSIKTYQPAEIDAILRDPGALVTQTTMHCDPVDMCVPDGTPTDKAFDIARRILEGARLWTPDHDRKVCGKEQEGFLQRNQLVEALCLCLNETPLIVAQFSSLAEPSYELRFAAWKRSLGFTSRYAWD